MNFGFFTVLQTRIVIQMLHNVSELTGKCYFYIQSKIMVKREKFSTAAPWEEVGRAHGEFFREIRPATSMIEVSALIRPESMVEIEFTAHLI